MSSSRAASYAAVTGLAAAPLTATLAAIPALAQTELHEAATLIDLGVTYSPAESVDIYGSVQNLTNAQYPATGYTLTSFEGSTVNATAIPKLGMPLTVIAGLRVKF